VNRIKYNFLFIVLLLCYGCSPVAVLPVFYNPKDVQQLDEPIVKESVIIKVKLEKENVDSYVSENNFRIALTEIIRQSNIFGNETKDAYTLNANVYKALWPSAGMTMDSELCSRYTLFFKEKEVWKNDICYKGVATGSEALFGSARSILAFNRANQGHMTILISSLTEHMNKMKQENNIK
jgi:hypothetical protein